MKLSLNFFIKTPPSINFNTKHLLGVETTHFKDHYSIEFLKFYSGIPPVASPPLVIAGFKAAWEQSGLVASLQIHSLGLLQVPSSGQPQYGIHWSHAASFHPVEQMQKLSVAGSGPSAQKPCTHAGLHTGWSQRWPSQPWSHSHVLGWFWHLPCSQPGILMHSVQLFPSQPSKQMQSFGVKHLPFSHSSQLGISQ